MRNKEYWQLPQDLQYGTIMTMKNDKNGKEIVPAATKIAVFRGKEVRKTIHNNEWWFVVEDVVEVLTDSSNPKQYIQRMKLRDGELAKGWVQIVHTLSVTAPISLIYNLWHPSF
jgi:hypothetical protein